MKEKKENVRIKLSVAMATFNEEKNLKNSLESVREIADEIVIVDEGSADRTLEIANRFEAKIISVSHRPIFHISKQQAIDECKGEWILQLDADEVIPSELAEEIRKIVNNQEEQDNRLVAYWIKRKKMFLGRWMKKGGQYPDPVIRLFKKEKAFLPCQSVHEQLTVEGETGWLQNEMVHFPTPNFSVYITKDNRYSTLTALEMEEKNIPLNLFSFLKYAVWEPKKTFLKIFFRHRGFQDGFPGFVFAFYSGLHILSAFIKYWESKTSKKEIDKDWI